MRETITPEMINAVQNALKNAEYDFETLKINIFGGEISPCSITQGIFPQIIDLALEHLKRKASHSLVEWIGEKEPKTSNIEYVKVGDKHEFRLKNKVLPQFDWSMVK